MALERAREYELRQRQFEQSAVEFYRLSHRLLRMEGGEYMRVLRGEFADLDDHGIGMKLQKYRRDIPFIVFSAEVANSDGSVSTVVLSTISESKEQLALDPKEIAPAELYENEQGELYSSFDLHIEPYRCPVDLIMQARKPVLTFNIGNFEPKDNCVTVYNKNFLVNGRFNTAIPVDAFDELEEIVELVRNLGQKSFAYWIAYPISETPTLDKAQA